MGILRAHRDTRRPVRKSGAQLLAEYIEEIESFLNGTYAARLFDSGTEVPVWALLNAVAHGAPADIERIARRSTGRTVIRSPEAGKDAALTLMARELLASADDHRVPVGELQTRVLIPLELDWSTRADLADAGPADLFLAVQSVLTRDESDFSA